MRKMVGEQLSYIAAPFLGIREAVGVFAGFNQYSGPAGTRAFSEVVKLLAQVQQGEVDEQLLRALNSAAGVLFHLPATQIDRTVRGIEAVIEDDAPLKSVLFGPPK